MSHSAAKRDSSAPLEAVGLPTRTSADDLQHMHLAALSGQPLQFALTPSDKFLGHDIILGTIRFQ